MSAINGVLTALCSLYRCFPNDINTPTVVQRGYLHTFNISLGYPVQNVSVALDLSSPDFWVFGGSKLTAKDQAALGTPVFDLNKTSQLYVDPNAVVYKRVRKKGLYEFDFDLKLFDARTTVDIGASSLGIPTVGINSNLSQLVQFLAGSSGMFGIQRSLYANSIPMRTQADSILTLHMPRFPATAGRLVTGNRSIDECSSKWTYLKLIGSANDSSSFAFYSATQSKSVIISTTTSYLNVDPKTFRMIEEGIKRVVYDREHPPRPNRPNRRHKLIPCAAVKHAPPITMGDKSTGLLTLEGHHYIRKTRSGYCILKVRQTSGSSWIAGAPLLQRYCLRIDLAKQKLGFAVAKNSD